MSNSNPNTTEAMRRAQHDAQHGPNMADTKNWDWNARTKYEAEYNRNKK